MAEKSRLPGTKTLLMGDIGTGKTKAIESALAAGLKPLCVFTEAGYGVLGEALREAIGWVYVKPIKGSLEDLQKMVKSIGTKEQAALAKETDPARYADSPLDQIMASMFRFQDQNGKDWGNISTWGTGILLVLDSLSGLTKASWQNVAGNRALVGMPDYMLAQKQIENLVALTCGLRCHLLITAHAEKEVDPINGGMRIYPSLPGKALAPIIGRDFDEVILAKREATKFSWTNIEDGAALKKRYLPYAAGQQPSFLPLIEAWKKQGGIIEPLT